MRRTVSRSVGFSPLLKNKSSRFLPLFTSSYLSKKQNFYASKRSYSKLFSKEASQESKSQFPSHLLNIPPTNISVLDNKLRVASEYKVGEMATVGVWIDAGSVWEDDSTNGVAHFLEHMAFKGTKTRTRQQIEIEIENMGGSLNAYTSREQTVYYAHVFKEDVPKAVEILSDILQNSVFSEKDIENERSVILREMEEVETQTEEIIFDHLHSVAFQGTSLGYTILGPERNIKSIKKDDLLRYISKHYVAPRMVLVGAGAVDHNQLVDLGNKYFGKLSSGDSTTISKPATNFPFTGSMVAVRNNALPLLHFAVAVKSVDWTSPDYFTFMLLQVLVGSWDRSLGAGKNLSSRLCEHYAISQQAHSLMSFNTSYHKTGLFGAYVVCEEHSGEDAIYSLLEEWTRICGRVSPLEVERAKQKLKSTYLMQLDGTTSTAEDIGRQLLTLGRRMTPGEVCLRINEIDADKVQKVAYNYIYNKEPAVAAIGPVDNAHFPDYHHIRTSMSKLYY